MYRRWPGNNKPAIDFIIHLIRKRVKRNSNNKSIVKYGGEK